MNPNFRDMLFALLDENAEFLIIGAYALAFHGMPRSTGDLDILVRPTPSNADKVWRALLRFGAPLSGLSPQEFGQPDFIFTVGREPFRIDILTQIDGVEFITAWDQRTSTTIEGRPIPMIGMPALLTNKRAAGRLKDAYDVAWLEHRLKEIKPSGN